MNKKLLKGFLSEPAGDLTMKFNASHQFDRMLFRQDIAVSMAQIKMLKSVDMLTEEEYATLRAALQKTEETIAADKIIWSDALEDIHMHIENQVIQLCGDVGRKLHMGRSRNDQVATDIRLYVRAELDAIMMLMRNLQKILAQRATEYYATLMPGFTHLQPAQPITFGHHLMAWHEMIERDAQRMEDCRKRINQMPLGAAALAGTSFPLNRDLLAQELGFTSLMDNSLDAVSTRDFAVEFLSAAAICMQNLSRWSEELILWCSPAFGFVELPADLCTGSSIMPQKKNPDLPELVRGKSARIFGHLMSLLSLMKGQPLAYNKDNQEDKEPLFDSVKTLKDCLSIWCLLAEGLQADSVKMRQALGMGHINATRLADYLTAKGVPFRKSYEIAGAAVRVAMKKNVELQDLALTELQKLSPDFHKDVYPLLDYTNIVASYDLPGGSAPKRVKAAAQKALRLAEKRIQKGGDPQKQNNT